MTEAIRDYLLMGGYAGFVWPAYGVAALVLVVFAVNSWRRLRHAVALLHRLEAESAAWAHHRQTAVARPRNHLRPGQRASDQRTAS